MSISIILWHCMSVYGCVGVRVLWVLWVCGHKGSISARVGGTKCVFQMPVPAHCHWFMPRIRYLNMYDPQCECEWLNGWMNEWMNEWVSEWMNERVDWVCPASWWRCGSFYSATKWVPRCFHFGLRCEICRESISLSMIGSSRLSLSLVLFALSCPGPKFILFCAKKVLALRTPPSPIPPGVNNRYT